jgi:hypothetical protein
MRRDEFVSNRTSYRRQTFFRGEFKSSGFIFAGLDGMYRTNHFVGISVRFSLIFGGIFQIGKRFRYSLDVCQDLFFSAKRCRLFGGSVSESAKHLNFFPLSLSAQLIRETERQRNGGLYVFERATERNPISLRVSSSGFRCRFLFNTSF